VILTTSTNTELFSSKFGPPRREMIIIPVHGIQKMLSWYPEVHVALHASRVAFPKINFKIFAKTQSSESDQNSVITLPCRQFFSQLSTSFLCCTLPSIHSQRTTHLLHFPKFHVVSSLILPEGRAGTTLEPSEYYTFLSPPPPLSPLSLSRLQYMRQLNRRPR
jgi:hypothetical protein